MSKTAWVDREGNRLEMEQISDRHLMNILMFLENGGGYTSFLNPQKVENLFIEADVRGLKHPYNLVKALHKFSEKVAKKRESSGLLSPWDMFTS